MKVAYWYNNKDIRVEEVPTPTPGPKEMLVKIISCGICGSDVVEWYRLPRAPLVQGHEIGAQVVKVGDSVKKFNPGDRVFIAPKVPCGKCFYCQNGHYPQCSEIRERLPGGFAEYILVPETIVESGTYLLPEHITYDQSTFIEPLACVVRAQRMAGVKKEDSVLVIGCGMSGLLHVKLARSKGCKVIAADLNKMKLQFAANIGAAAVIDATGNIRDRLIAETGKNADVVLLCASADSALEQAWSCVDKGGVIVLFAVPAPDRRVVVPVNDFWMKEITILTSYYCGPSDIAEAIKLIDSGNIAVDDLITHRLALDDIVQGFQLVSDSRESIKVIIKPQKKSIA
ncbi:MAG: alcohol dehydrogenase [Deltaproteobacteria bacterium HGW-Deltaproteobacteria-12]|jgi:L-iditol 2-dehydrogenase|nr:MAG: alcohol dehydrogenase [Deltaproteobacteria bacterium HGW-Deltaproteobacteria-12]